MHLGGPTPLPLLFRVTLSEAIRVTLSGAKGLLFPLAPASTPICGPSQPDPSLAGPCPEGPYASRPG